MIKQPLEEYLEKHVRKIYNDELNTALKLYMIMNFGNIISMKLQLSKFTKYNLKAKNLSTITKLIQSYLNNKT